MSAVWGTALERDGPTSKEVPNMLSFTNDICGVGYGAATVKRVGSIVQNGCRDWKGMWKMWKEDVAEGKI